MLRFGVLPVVFAALVVAVGVRSEDSLDEVELAGGLLVTKLSIPDACERKTAKGDQLKMHYTGRIAETSETGVKGTQFDSSVGREPFSFQLGAGQVIKGWDQGLLDMCVGEKRVLTIPAALGYGDSGAGADIPGGATLHFDVELVGITEGNLAPQVNVFKQIDTDGSGGLSRDEVRAFMRGMALKHGEEDGEELEGQLDGHVDSVFEAEDADKDGTISHGEFSGPKDDPEDTGEGHDEL